MTTIKIAASSPSFCKNSVLVKALLHIAPESRINHKLERFNEETLSSFLGDNEVAIIGTETVSETILKKCPNLRFIAKYGVGLNNIDLDACAKAGVEVGWTGGVNKRSVSEMTLAFMISLIRNLYPSSLALKKGQWLKEGGAQLSEKTIGIIGVGHIGKDLISLLKPFNCKVLVNDIVDQKKYYDEHSLIETSKKDLYQKSDIITIHTPLTENTLNMIDEKELSLMKPSAFLINTARGGIINETALEKALKNKTIAGAAIDAYVIEPPQNESLLTLANLFCTPHIGGNAEEAVLAMGQSALYHLKNYLEKRVS